MVPLPLIVPVSLRGGVNLDLAVGQLDGFVELRHGVIELVEFERAAAGDD